jgi:hypothetical protein
MCGKYNNSQKILLEPSLIDICIELDQIHICAIFYCAKLQEL